jgi:CRISPR-associated endonuclease Csn1
MLLDKTDPWILRCKGLAEPLQPHEFGRVILHLSQRRGALGFEADVSDEGKVKKAVVDLQFKMLEKLGAPLARTNAERLRGVIETLEHKKKRSDTENAELETAREGLRKLCRELLEDHMVTFGRFMAILRDERRNPITTGDKRKKKKGPREWREPIRNKAGNFEFHADRAMIRDEFVKLWEAQKRFGGVLAEKLTEELRIALDNESSDGDWRHKGLLFGQRRASWDVGTLGRCVLHPTDRCVPHADMYASHYLVVETVNNLKIIERGMPARSLTADERAKIKDYLSGPLGVVTKGKHKGQPKRSVAVSDLRTLMGWGRSSKTAQFRFNIESDEERNINTDWFSREIVHGAITQEKWAAMGERTREGINRAILKHDPDDEKHAAKLKRLVMQAWAGLTEDQADALVAAWKQRPRLDAKRLNMSRRAVRNLLTFMDRNHPWPDITRPGHVRWLTQIEARKMIANDPGFVDVSTGKPLDDYERRRYATGAKGATARDRHYMRKHLLKREGKLVYGSDGLPLRMLPPAPMISNPVVRKSIHEVRRHILEHLIKHECKPDEICIELAREAKMGKVDADRRLFMNRLQNRIRKEISTEFNLYTLKTTQRRAAEDRVILAVQQDCVCPLCGKCDGITLRAAAEGVGCEVAHIVPRAVGGHSGFGNLILAHVHCNREMRRKTPRDYWDNVLPGGFKEGIAWVENIYGNIVRIKPSETKTATGVELWKCYLTEQARPKRGSTSSKGLDSFTKRIDLEKIEQFKKTVSEIQGMTPSQKAATTYATRQLMAYLADSLFDGEGLPERGGDRTIFATDGLWTGRIRREWGLFFDPHESRAKGLTNGQEHERKEKDRGDHRHHAIDAVAIALCTQQVRSAWQAREQQADKEGINTADEVEMEGYRRLHPLPVPAPFRSPEHLREEVRLAVFGNGEVERPVCHRPAKRKLVGALHEETLFGPVVNASGELTNNFTARKSVYELTPNHLRMPSGWDELLAKCDDPSLSSAAKRALRKQLAAMEDPSPGKSGIVRDRTLRQRIRSCLREAGLDLGVYNPKYNTVQGGFTKNQLKKAIDAGMLKHVSGVPIRSVVLLRTMTDPVIIDRKRCDMRSGRMTIDSDPASRRAYLAGNNHHIEIRVAKNKQGKEVWSGTVVTSFEAAQRKLARLRAIRKAGVPDSRTLRKLPKSERERFKSVLQEIEKSYPVIDRTDKDKEGKFVMSLSEGETLLVKHKHTGELGYFIVAKLDKPQRIVVVPHWDARSATERKDSKGQVPDSKRDQFDLVPADLKTLAPPGYPHAVKVRVTPLGEIRMLIRD